MDNLFSMLSLTFVQRALIVGTLIALCASLLGVSLVLKKYSMIGDGLSHVSFGALAIGAALNIAPMIIALPVAIIAAFVLLKISSSRKIKGDAAIAVISSSSLAIGIMIVSLTGTNIDLENYMFGSILGMSNQDVIISIILAVFVLVIYVFLYHKIFAITFDETFARATGVKVGLYNSLLAILTAITIVIGMKIMGALLISSLVIFPPLSSMKTFKSFKKVTISSAIIAIICVIAGVLLSCILDTPTGATIVCVGLIALIIFTILSYVTPGFRHKRK